MTGWRLVAARVVAFLLVYVLSGLPMFSGSLLGQRRWDTLPGTLLWVLLVPVFWIGTAYLTRWVGVQDLGLRWQKGAGRQLLLGLAIGTGHVALILYLAFATRSLTITGFTVAGLAPLRLLFFALEFFYVAVSEELLFRAFLVKLLPRSLPRVWVALITAALFAAAHLPKSGLDWISLSLTFLMGLLFLFPYLRTGALWASIGLHAAYNILNLLLIEQERVLTKQWAPGEHLWVYSVATVILLLILQSLWQPPRGASAGRARSLH